MLSAPRILFFSLLCNATKWMATPYVPKPDGDPYWDVPPPPSRSCSPALIKDTDIGPFDVIILLLLSVILLSLTALVLHYAARLYIAVSDVTPHVIKKKKEE